MSSRTECIRDLCTVLEAEERAYLELRTALQREREALVRLDADALAALVEEKNGLGAEARLLEESRLDVARRLGALLGWSDEPRPLAQLCDALGADAAPLVAVHGRLRALLGAVRELVAANAAFAGSSLDQVQATLRVLGRLQPPEPIYRPTNDSDPSPPAGRLVRQTA